MSSGNSLSNDIFSLVVGCKKLRCLACRACLGKFINKLEKILVFGFGKKRRGGGISVLDLNMKFTEVVHLLK